MTRLRAFGASAGRRRSRTVGTSARPARLSLLLLVAALEVLAAQPAAGQTEVVEYYGHDALGSIRIVFSASGVATARADFEPFGERVTIAGMPAGPLPAQQFTGQERDAVEHQDYFGARYYRPRHGRFSQVDPVYAGLFDPQQWNRYAYARNNPLSFVDPDGRQVQTFRFSISCPPDCIIVGGPAPRPPLPPVFGVGLSASVLRPDPRPIDAGRGLGVGARANGPTLTDNDDGDQGGGGDSGNAGQSSAINQFTDLLGQASEVSQALGAGAVVGAGAASVANVGAGLVRLFPPIGQFLSRLPGVQWLQVQRFQHRVSTAIAQGHAFGKHVVQAGEFPGIHTQAQFASHIRTYLKIAEVAS
jgi:RHS repeat-associated protein